ncbi:MAG: hypothetical protein AB9903_16000 [Vulcanimicrobiota bacterium]
MKRIYFIKASIYTSLIALFLMVVMNFLNYVDILQQLDKCVIALTITSLIGGFFGSFISEYATE